MRGRKSIYQNRRRRMLIIDAVGAVIGLVLYFMGVYELWFVLFILFLFCWIIYILFGPGLMIGRVYRIQKERDIRILTELPDVSRGKRRLDWVQDMKRFATYTYENEKGQKMYVIPGLPDPIALDFLEKIVYFDDWEEYADLYVDWEKFKVEYPWMDSFSDYSRRKRKKRSRNKDYNVLDDDEYYDKYYDRHMRWINEMKRECTYEGNGPGGEDTYSSPLLWQNIPLNDLEIFAGSKTFNYQVSQYIDWENFHLNFPELETWECEEDDDEDYD